MRMADARIRYVCAAEARFTVALDKTAPLLSNARFVAPLLSTSLECKGVDGWRTVL